MKRKAAQKKAFPAARLGADVVDGFLCPDCGVGKHEFATIEIDRSE